VDLEAQFVPGTFAHANTIAAGSIGFLDSLVGHHQTEMSGLRRTMGFGLVLLVGVACAVVGAVLGISEWKLWRQHDVPLTQLRTVAPLDLAEGGRMARIVG
jgi:hypothetical protein